MKRKLLFLIFVVLLGLPRFSFSGCVDIGFFNEFVLEEKNRVILYFGRTSVVRFDVQSCPVKPSSKIRLIKSYVCDGEDILIDDSKCTILNIERLGP